jgi:phosphatidylglycerophosphate synthase
LNTRATFKPRDVEEPIDFWLNRPLASILVKGLAPLPISPNQVTVLSGLVGLLSGVVIATSPIDNPWQVPLGGAVLYLSILLDCADGQLARLRGESSMVGRFLDGVVDVVSIGGAYVGFAIFLYRAGWNFWLINAVGWSSGYAMKVHVHGYDHAKNLFLANTRPAAERARAMPTVEEILRESEVLQAKGDAFGARVLRGFATFTNSQRQGWQVGRIGIGMQGSQDDRERALYRDRFARTMQLWTWDGLGLHLVLFVIAAGITPYFQGAIFVVWVFFLVPQNAFTAYIVWKEKRIERALQAELKRTAPAA